MAAKYNYAYTKIVALEDFLQGQQRELPAIVLPKGQAYKPDSFNPRSLDPFECWMFPALKLGDK